MDARYFLAHTLQDDRLWETVCSVPNPFADRTANAASRKSRNRGPSLGRTRSGRGRGMRGVLRLLALPPGHVSRLRAGGRSSREGICIDGPSPGSMSPPGGGLRRHLRRIRRSTATAINYSTNENSGANAVPPTAPRHRRQQLWRHTTRPRPTRRPTTVYGDGHGQRDLGRERELGPRERRCEQRVLAIRQHGFNGGLNAGSGNARRMPTTAARTANSRSTATSTIPRATRLRARIWELRDRQSTIM